MIHADIQTADVARHYDELDRFYQEIWGEHLHHGLWIAGDESPEDAVLQLLQEVVRHGQIGAGDAVCDVGCGYGATARTLAAELGAQVTGLTLSDKQYRYAQDRAPTANPPPTYLLQDWLANDLPADHFDAVLFIESLSHMTDIAQALHEAARVVRPGGRVVLCAWMANAWPGRWASRYILEPICREGRLPGMPSAIDLHCGLRDAGLTVEVFHDWSTQVRRTWDVVIRRVVKAVLTRPDYRQYLADRAQQNRRFALTLLRLWIGYRIGVVGYGFFVATKPER